MAQRFRHGGVIANFEITKPRVDKSGRLKWLYVPEDEMTPEMLMDYSLKYARDGHESEILLIIDEAHRILNSRSWADKVAGQNRLLMLRFLSEARHFGYDVILISQSIEMLDKQARFLIEIEVKHVKANKRWWWLPVPVFLQVEYWYNMPKFHGKLRVNWLPVGKGRYDHQAMKKRQRAAASAARLAAAGGLLGPLGSELAGLSKIGRAEIHQEALQEVARAGSRPAVTQDGGLEDGAVLSVGGDGDLGAAVEDGDHPAQVVGVGVGEGDAVGVVVMQDAAQGFGGEQDFGLGQREYAKLVWHARRFLQSKGWGPAAR